MKKSLVLLHSKQFFNSKIRVIYYIVRYISENPARLYKFPLYLYRLYTKGYITTTPRDFGDYKLILNLRSSINRTLFFKGEAYPFHRLFLKQHLEDDGVFFDIGAHSGFFSIFAATIIKKGEIHAFEPIPQIYQDFDKSISLNNIKNIKLNRICLGDREGKVKFHLSNWLDTSGIKETELQVNSKLIEVRITKLLTYCKVNKIKKIDVLKIDVEGGEKDILFPAKEVIRKFKPFIIAEFSTYTSAAYNYHPNEIYDFLEELGYKMYKYKNGKLVGQKKKKVYGEDLFCIPY